MEDYSEYVKHFIEGIDDFMSAQPVEKPIEFLTQLIAALEQMKIDAANPEGPIPSRF